GAHMLALAWGRDSREVVPDEAARSIGAEETFAEDIAEAELLEARLLEIAERLGRRLRRAGVAGHTVTLKIKYADFQLISRSRTFETPTDLTRELWEAARALLREKVDLSRPVRLAGIQVSHLLGAGDRQADLFEPEVRRKEARLERGVDAIREKFGRGAVVRATLLEREAEDEDVQKIDRREE
ncbi:MAG: DNA polymerase IV, partial [Candidatus Methylomirabilis sp.]|nr:DNA polymerase IV [Deltaproteobacteria bacterium]